jgi:hypothetical protein
MSSAGRRNPDCVVSGSVGWPRHSAHSRSGDCPRRQRFAGTCPHQRIDCQLHLPSGRFELRPCDRISPDSLEPLNFPQENFTSGMDADGVRPLPSRRFTRHRRDARIQNRTHRVIDVKNVSKAVISHGMANSRVVIPEPDSRLGNFMDQRAI